MLVISHDNIESSLRMKQTIPSVGKIRPKFMMWAHTLTAVYFNVCVTHLNGIPILWGGMIILLFSHNSNNDKKYISIAHKSVDAETLIGMTIIANSATREHW